MRTERKKEQGTGKKEKCMKLFFCALVLLGFAGIPSGWAEDEASKEQELLRQLQMLNQVPEEQLSDKVDPGFSVLKKIYDLDSPDFLVFRKLLGRADIRKDLNPSVRAISAGIISQRWDSFTLSGNLYLSGLRSVNADLREKSRQRLVSFIQPAHIPVLIETLKIPGPNIAAVEVLREVTRQNYGADRNAWTAWWKRAQGKIDMVGMFLKDTRDRVANIGLQPFDQERFWYVPDGISNALTPYAQRSVKEQSLVSEWNNWANIEVKRYVDTWSVAKPIIDRIKHQPDPRVNQYFESLTTHPGFGDYACVLLAWRANRSSLPAIQQSYDTYPTVGKALARGTLGDPAGLVNLLSVLDSHQKRPLTYGMMDEQVRSFIPFLRQVGVVPAEQAYELLAHRRFDFDSAATPSEKRKAFKVARQWLESNAKGLKFDRKRGYYISGQ